MAVKVSQSGGIYIEISGDYTQLQRDLRAVTDLSRTAGTNISKALEGAIDPRRAASSINGLTQTLMKAQAAGKALAVDFSSQEKAIREWGQMVGIAGKELDHYVAIQTKALKLQAEKTFAGEVRNLQRLTGLTNEEMNALAKSLGGTGTEFNKASRSTRELCLNMTTLYLEAAKVAALKAIWDGFKGSFDLAARYETLGVVVQQVGKVAGHANVEIDKNVNALRRMGIAGLEARKTMTQLIQAQVDIGKSPALARIAQDAAVIGGTNSSDAFEKMVHGIQSAQTEVLRTIGINVNFEQSYAKMAASLGKTTSELTEQEKVQARVNAVMEAGERISGSYEASMTTLGKQMSSLTRIQQDFLTDAGKMLLEVAKASGGVTTYTNALEGWNAVALAARGKLAGVSMGELKTSALTGGVQGMRELVEGFESAREEVATLEAQLQTLGSKGIDVTVISAELEKTKKDFFGTREEVYRLQENIALLEAHGIDTSHMVARLETLMSKLREGPQAVDIFRKSLGSLGAIVRAQFTQAAENDPARYFRFGDGAREIESESAKLEAAYAKTATRVKQQKTAVIKEQRELTKALATAGKYTPAEAQAMDKAFSAELASLNKSGASAAKAADRTAYQANEAARAAADSLKNLQLRYSELVSQITGNSLGAALEKSQRDLETQLDAIAKKEREITKNRATWGKEGKLTSEVSGYLDEQQKALDQERGLHWAIKVGNDLLIVRTEAARTFRANMDYAGLVGDLKAYYAEEVKLLQLQQIGTSEAERRAYAERIRIATARRDVDVPELLSTGWMDQSKQAQQGYIDFFEKGVPGAFASAADSFGTFTSDIATGTKSIGSAWAELGKSLSSSITKMLADLTSLYLKMALFGQASQSGGQMGGLFGIAFSAIRGLFGSPSFSSFNGYTLPNMNLGEFYAPSNHNGGIVGIDSGPRRALSPSAFAAAPRYHTGGIAGLRPDEIPSVLRRGEEVLTTSDPRHRNNAGGGSAPFQPTFSFSVQNTTSTPVSVRQNGYSQDGAGNFDIRLLLAELDNGLAQMVAGGQSRTAAALDKTRGLNSAGSLYS